MQVQWLHLLAASASTIAAAPLATANDDNNDSCPSEQLPVRTVAQLASQPAYLENIVVRSNGDLLVTQNLPQPRLYTIKQPWLAEAGAELVLVHEFQDADGASGIVEIAPDHFIVSTTKWDGFSPVAASATLQFVKLSSDNGSVVDSVFVGRYLDLGLLNDLAATVTSKRNCHSQWANTTSVLATDSVLGVNNEVILVSADGTVSVAINTTAF